MKKFKKSDNKTEALTDIDMGRKKIIEKLKKEVSTSTYKIKSTEIADKIAQRLREDLPLINPFRR